MIDRIPAHDLDAEKSLISSILLNNECYFDVDYLNPSDFYKSANGKIFNAIIELIESGEPADLVTIAKFLENNKDLSNIGGASYLSKISDNIPSVLNFKSYAKIIKDCSLIRETTTKALKIADKGFNKPNAKDLINEFQRVSLSLDSGVSDEILTSSEFANWSLSKIESDIVDSNSDGLNTGFYGLDEIINITGPKLILIAARPKTGKTAFMTTLINNMCSMYDYSIGVLSLEMDKKELADRWIADLADINPMKFRFSGQLDKSQIEDIKIACDRISRWKMFIDDNNCNIDDIKRKCRKMKKMGVQAIFIDQLSKISGGDKDLFIRFTDHTNQLALLKKELRIPIFLLCQIKRNTNQIPTMSDLKQTGSLEEDADMVFILYREENERHLTDLKLVAHRQGGIKDFKIHFNPNRIVFNNLQI